MKKLLIIVLAAFLMLGVASTAQAIVLAPGTAYLISGAASPGGGLVTSLINIPFTGTDAGGNIYFTGTLSQWVRSNPTGLLFEYQVTNDLTSLDPIARMSATKYTGFYTDAEAVGGGLLPYYVARTLSGSTVSFDYPVFSAIVQGATSPIMWIQTDAPKYTLGSTVLLDGGRAGVQTYAPAIPEPASMLLLGMGILGLFGLKRKV